MIKDMYGRILPTQKQINVKSDNDIHEVFIIYKIPSHLSAHL